MPIIETPDTPELFELQNSFRAGEVSNRDGPLIPRDAARRIFGATMDMDGSIIKSIGMAKRGPANLDLSAVTAHGLFFLANPDANVLLGRWGNELYSMNDVVSSPDNEFRWNRRASNVSFVDTHYMAVQGKPAGANAIETMYMVACVSASRTGGSYSHIAYLEFGGNPVTVSGAMITTNGPGLVKGLSYFQRRLWAIDEDNLRWSNIGDPKTWAGAQSVAIGTDATDMNMALFPLREPTPRMLIFRRNSIWLLDIYWLTDGFNPSASNTLDYGTGGGAGSALLRPIVQEVGLVAPRAATWIPGGTDGDYLFLSRDGIRSLKRSISDTQAGASIPLSWRLQPLIDRINWPYVDRSLAIYHKGIAYFGIPIDDSTEPNRVVAYDVRQDHMYELDQYPAGWCEGRYPEKDIKLYLQSATKGNENYTNPTFNLNHSHVYDTSTGVSGMFSTAQNMILVTRAYSFDLAEPQGSGIKEKKRLNWLEIAARARGTTATIAIDYRINGWSNWTALGHFNLPPSEFDFLKRRFSLRKLPPAYYIDFRLTDNTTFGQPEIQSIQVSAFPLNPRYSG